MPLSKRVSGSSASTAAEPAPPCSNPISTLVRPPRECSCQGARKCRWASPGAAACSRTALGLLAERRAAASAWMPIATKAAHTSNSA